MESAGTPMVARDKERHRLRLEFWGQALDALKAEKVIRYQNIGPTRDHWLSAGSGLSGVHYSMLFLKEGAGVQFVMDRRKEKNKAMFDYLHARRSEIEAIYGGLLEWHRLDDKKAAKIMASQPFEGYDRATWPAMIAWLVANIRRLENAFAPHVNALRDLLKTQFPKAEVTEEVGNGSGA